MTDRLRIADEVAELLSREAAVASLGRLRLLERKAALPSELLRLVMGNPLWMFFEREIDVVRVGDPDGPVDLPFYFLDFAFQKTSLSPPISTGSVSSSFSASGASRRRNQRMSPR